MKGGYEAGAEGLGAIYNFIVASALYDCSLARLVIVLCGKHGLSLGEFWDVIVNSAHADWGR